MSGSAKKLLHAAAGSASGDPVYVEEVFSTDLYTGNNSSQTITNGLDLSGEGGLVWAKQRGYAESHTLLDTERGATKILASDTTDAQMTIDGGFDAFTSTGFTLKADNGWNINKASRESVAWSFRKQTGFFDVVTYTGTGSSKTVSHNLGCVPGMIIVKMTTTSGYKWRVWHKSLGNSKALCLNDYSAENDDGGGGGGWWNNTAPTSSVFSVGTYGQVNNNGDTFVAYLFADGDNSAAQIFGDDGDEAIIKCGSYQSTGNGDEVFVDLGFEPQWVMIKSTTDTNSGYDPYGQPWLMQDIMRGMAHPSTTNNPSLFANLNGAENSTGTAGWTRAEATGITIGVAGAINMFNSVQTYAYIAIRRGPMKEPDAGTDVFSMAQPTSNAPLYKTGKLVDMAFNRQVHTAADLYLQTRLFSGNYLRTNTTDATSTDSSSVFDYQTGYYNSSYNDTNAYGWAFRRFPKVFDHIVYKGTNGGGSASSYVDTYPHNLGVKPEMIIIKATDNTAYGLNWEVWHTGLLGSIANLADDSAAANGLSDSATADGVRFRDHSTASVIGRTNSSHTNSSSHSYIGLLFASLSGISAVNKYTGTGNDINVTDLGAAARFVLIKRVDSSGDWYVYDSTRGIVSGNDPYLFINSNAAQVTNTDYIDPHSSGFTVTSSAPDALNASGGTYIYLAFA